MSDPGEAIASPMFQLRSPIVILPPVFAEGVFSQDVSAVHTARMSNDVPNRFVIILLMSVI